MFSINEEEIKDSGPIEKIQLKHLIIAFLVLGAGCFIALVVFMFEMIWGGKVEELQPTNVSENTDD